MSCFFGHNIAEGGGGGMGRLRDEPKAEKKIVARSRVLRNNYLEELFHTVPSSFVLWPAWQAQRRLLSSGIVVTPSYTH